MRFIGTLVLALSVMPALAADLDCQLGVTGGALYGRSQHVHSSGYEFTDAFNVNGRAAGVQFGCLAVRDRLRYGAALDLMAHLWREGLWVPAIRPPTVPQGTARLRVTLTAAHSDADVSALIASLVLMRPRYFLTDSCARPHQLAFMPICSAGWVRMAVVQSTVWILAIRALLTRRAARKILSSPFS